MKPFGAEDLLHACQQIVQDKTQLSGDVPEEVRRNFSFEPTLLSGGVHAVEKAEQMYAGADEYMRTGGDDEDDEIGASSLSKELKQMGVLKKHKADQRRKAKAEKLRQANAALMPSSEEEDASGDEESEASSSSSKKKDNHKKRGSKKKSSRVHMVDTVDVHEYDQDDIADLDSADEADASIVAANTRAFSGVLGQLEDVHSAEQEEAARARVAEFITLGCLGQPNAGSVLGKQYAI